MIRISFFPDFDQLGGWVSVSDQIWKIPIFLIDLFPKPFFIIRVDGTNLREEKFVGQLIFENDCLDNSNLQIFHSKCHCLLLHIQGYQHHNRHYILNPDVEIR